MTWLVHDPIFTAYSILHTGLLILPELYPTRLTFGVELKSITLLM